MGQADRVSGSVEAQMLRWDNFLQKWQQAIASNSEIHVLGDLNLNFLDFFKQGYAANGHYSKLRPLIQSLLDCVMPHGFSQLISEATRFRQGQTPSLLDQFWTNTKEESES